MNSGLSLLLLSLAFLVSCGGPPPAISPAKESPQSSTEYLRHSLGLQPFKGVVQSEGSEEWLVFQRDGESVARIPIPMSEEVLCDQPEEGGVWHLFEGERSAALHLIEGEAFVWRWDEDSQCTSILVFDDGSPLGGEPQLLEYSYRFDIEEALAELEAQLIATHDGDEEELEVLLEEARYDLDALLELAPKPVLPSTPVRLPGLEHDSMVVLGPHGFEIREGETLIDQFVSMEASSFGEPETTLCETDVESTLEIAYEGEASIWFFLDMKWSLIDGDSECIMPETVTHEEQLRFVWTSDDPALFLVDHLLMRDVHEDGGGGSSQMMRTSAFKQLPIKNGIMRFEQDTEFLEEDGWYESGDEGCYDSYDNQSGHSLWRWTLIEGDKEPLILGEWESTDTALFY